VCTATLLVVTTGLAANTVQRLGVGIAALAAVAGLLWLWGPLVKLDECLPVFPDV
jgi:hypothetical protein